MSWRLRTSFGDEVTVVREFEASGQGEAQRIAALFLRFELRRWLLGSYAADRRQLLEMYGALRSGTGGWGRSVSPADLTSYVLPALEEAFERGRLAAFKAPRADVRVHFVSATPVPAATPPDAPVSEPPPEAGVLGVTVTDRILHRPVAGARVEIGGPSTGSRDTDAQGVADFGTVPSGNYTITVKKTNYRDGNITAAVPGSGTVNARAEIEGIATIEILDDRGAVATFVRFGLWDAAFDATHSPFNEEAEANNFVGADSRRFFFRVRDPSAATRLNIEWKAVFAGGADFTDTPGSRQLTLLEAAASSGQFVSKAVMLVYDHDDSQTPTHSGLPAGTPDAGSRNFGQSNHRLRRADMFGGVVGAYTPAGGRAVVRTPQTPIFNRAPDQRKNIPVQIFVLRVAPGGAGVIPTASGSGVWSRDLRVMREVYGRLGLWVWTAVAPGVAPAHIATDGADSLVLIDPPAGVNPVNVTFSDETAICNAITQLPATIRIVYVGGLSSGNGGETWDDATVGSSDVRQGASFVIFGTGPLAAAHEAGHSLTSKPGGHFKQPTTAGTRLMNPQNHMKQQFLGPEGMTAPKRLWDQNDGDGFNQFTAIRGSRYTRS